MKKHPFEPALEDEEHCGYSDESFNVCRQAIHAQVHRFALPGELSDLNVTVVCEDLADEASAVVCGPVSYFTDDIHTVCADCGVAIVHRPHAPKRPRKVCMECFLKLVSHEGNRD